MNYMSSINAAVLIFPFIALLITMPFILSQYHKYGSISFFKSVIIYLFVFYLLCTYFLVILPLPKISEVAMMTSPRTQLIPFDFVIDFALNSSFDITNFHTYFKALKESYFYVPVFNIILTVPFGMFLRYYFKCDLTKVIIYSFLLSLFFELTQLSGLYFIYPRGYRLFDVDDLILNTLGGVVGYLICAPLLKILPKIDEVNEGAMEKGMKISGFRRLNSLLLDLFIFLVIEVFVIIVFGDHFYLNLGVLFIYYFIIPLFLGTSTPAKKFLNIAVLDYNNERNIPRLFLRKFLVIFIYIIIPIIIVWFMTLVSNDYVREFGGLIILLGLFLLYFISVIKYLFTGKEMLYEKLSKTRLVSTIKLNSSDISCTK